MHSGKMGTIIIGSALLVVALVLYLPNISIGHEQVAYLKETLVAIGAILVIPTFAMEAYSRIARYIRRPRLIFDTQKYIESVEENNQELYKLTFWVHVGNRGKETAIQSRIQVKLTESTGTINIVETMTVPHIDAFFPISWILGNNSELEAIDMIGTSDTHPGKFKMPFELKIPAKEDKSEGMKLVYSYNFNPPVGQWNPVIMNRETQSRLHLRIHVKVISPPHEYNQQFLLLVPQPQDVILKPNDIEFKLTESQ